jgi:hypothetical protein
MMDGSTTQARRYYHHAINGGTLNARDVARMVEAMEAKDAEVARLREALSYYADRKTYEPDKRYANEPWPIFDDEGALARATLQPKEGK